MTHDGCDLALFQKEEIPVSSWYCEDGGEERTGKNGLQKDGISRFDGEQLLYDDSGENSKNADSNNDTFEKIIKNDLNQKKPEIESIKIKVGICSLTLRRPG
jgi:hypothetical protein